MKATLRCLMTFALVLAYGTAMAQDEEAWGDPMDWVGKDAAAVKLPLVDGGELDTEAYEGKKVVVLDFWATWCPWCVKSTEHLVKRVEEYKDKDVAFYMIAVGQGREPVAKYIESKGLKVPMALDTDRKASDAYFVDYIPHVVVIGKDGKVSAVAIGEDKVGPAIDEALKALLAEGGEAATEEAPAE